MSHCNSTKKGHGCLECTLERIADRIVAAIEAKSGYSPAVPTPETVASVKETVSKVAETISEEIAANPTLGQKIKNLFSR